MGRINKVEGTKEQRKNEMVVCRRISDGKSKTSKIVTLVITITTEATRTSKVVVKATHNEVGSVIGISCMIFNLIAFCGSSQEPTPTQIPVRIHL